MEEIFLNEDLGGGSKYDYGIHKETIRLLFLDSNHQMVRLAFLLLLLLLVLC